MFWNETRFVFEQPCASWRTDHVNGLLSDYLDEFASYAFLGYSDPFYRWQNFLIDHVKNAQKFAQASDLIESFNLFGFHDVCNVLKSADIIESFQVPPYFDSRNATGTFMRIYPLGEKSEPTVTACRR